MTRAKLVLCLVGVIAVACEQAYAGTTDDRAVAAIKRQLDKQAKAIAEQSNQLIAERHLIELLEKRLAAQNALSTLKTNESPRRPDRPTIAAAVQNATSLDILPQNAVDSGNTVATAATSPSTSMPEPTQVGQAPDDKTRPPQIQTIASLGGVLTHGGTLVIEPYAEYIHTSLNQFTFEGVQIVDSLLIGVINAGTADQDLGLAGLTARYGITDRLEAEIRIPYVYRAQSLTGTLLNSSDSVVHETAHGSGLGDIEGAIHYQINDGNGDLPFFIGNLRYKSNTGSGPWDISYNADGSATTLPTGSGFVAINPSLTAIYPTEPAVLYGNIGWIHNFDNNRGFSVNQTVISQIRPGDTYSGSFGMGISLNDSVSFSLGYEQDYIQATREVVNSSLQLVQSLLAGELAFGISLKTHDQNTVNLNLNVGVTRDAPDMGLTLRTPISLGQPF